MVALFGRAHLIDKYLDGAFGREEGIARSADHFIVGHDRSALDEFFDGNRSVESGNDLGGVPIADSEC